MIKEKVLSHILLRPQGIRPTISHDEYGISKLGHDKKADIYLDHYNDEKLYHEIRGLHSKLRIKKLSSRFEIKLSLQFNRGYSLERYFFKEIRKSNFYTKNLFKANLVLLPATPYMYHVLGSFIARVYHVLFSADKSNLSYKAKRKKIIDYFLIGAINKWRKRPKGTLDKKSSILITSHIRGSGILNDKAKDIQSETILLSNSADNKFGPFDFKKDVAMVCNLDLKMPRYACDISAFSKAFDDRKIFTSFIGDVYGMRTKICSQKTERCVWIDHHIPFRDYVDIYASSKYYFHLPGHAEWSPRLFEGMFFGAVPVILYSSYILPFSDILDWSKFSILVPESDWNNVYQILNTINNKKYNQLQRNLKSALKHFCYHKKPVMGDAFYMVMLSAYMRHCKIKVTENEQFDVY